MQRFLVTGANGFLGTRLVEVLALAYGADVRAFVRDLSRSVRVCRLPIEIAVGDVRDERAVKRAMDGCSIVIHCASGIDAKRPLSSSTFVGTRVVARMAQLQKVQKFVHVSSTAVYGAPGEVEVNESYPLRPRWKNDVYGAAKIAGERLVHEYFLRGLPAAIIQPTIIYGPYSSEWSTHPLQTLRTSNYILPKGGLLSPVYVDDVVRAIIMATIKMEAVGHRFIISGVETVDWLQFYEAYARMGLMGRVLAVGVDEYSDLVKQRSFNISAADLGRLIIRQPDIRKAAKKNSLVVWSYNLAKRLGPLQSLLQLKTNNFGITDNPKFRLSETSTPSDFLPGPGLWELYKSRSRYSIAKAKRELGYRPIVDLERGMKMTAEWAKWARLI